MTELDILQSISDESSKNGKFALLKKHSNNQRLAQLLDAALNYKRIFYINKMDLGQSLVNEGVAFPDLHDEFIQLLSRLEKREITGNEARIDVVFFLIKCSKQQQDWYLKILRKDLKAGFSAETAAEAGFDIPLFDVMLAKDGKSCKNLKDIVSKGVYASPKFDGYRCLAVIDNGEVTLYSRAGTEFHNFPSIVESLQRSFPSGQYVFDGEIMSDDFQSMQKSAFASKRGTVVGDVKYYVFGCIPYQEWDSKQFNIKTKERLAILNGLKNSFEPNIVAVEQKFINSLDEALKFEVDCLNYGYEGAMLLPDIAYYLGKKSNKLLKLKTMQSQDCRITGFYEGEAGTRNEGTLGGLELIQENNISCRCGTGFSDDDRYYIWGNKEEFIGRIAEIKYQELTEDGVMRFPVFMRWRDDKVR
jgi:DNA ligase-1